MNLKKIFAAFLFISLFCIGANAAEYEQNWNSALKWLATQSNPDASFLQKKGARVGFSCLVLQAWNNAPTDVKKANPEFAALMSKTANYIASQQNPEYGYIADGPEYHNYSTALAVKALAQFDAKKYSELIKKAVVYLKQLQANSSRKFDPNKHITFGGFGYGSTLRPDLSNTWFALSALSAAGVPSSDAVFQNAIIFVKRCQNSTEVNDQPYAGTDGGSMYLPGNSAAGKEKARDGKTIHKSYGSMTSAMLSSYLYCGLKKDAKPVQLASKWLGNNFSVTANPGHQKEGQQALFYYYRALSTALSQYGAENFYGHDWKKDLAGELVKTQTKEGYWVNKEARFSENDPVLCTAYALYSLGLCEK